MPHLDDACADGEHVPILVGHWYECERCGLSSQTILDALGHSWADDAE